MQQGQTNGNFHPSLSFKEMHNINAESKKYFTIIMSKEKTPGVMRWRCYNCGGTVFEYYNVPKAGFDGAINIDDCEKPTDHLCRKCNIIYRVT